MEYGLQDYFHAYVGTRAYLHSGIRKKKNSHHKNMKEMKCLDYIYNLKMCELKLKPKVNLDNDQRIRRIRKISLFSPAYSILYCVFYR